MAEKYLVFSHILLLLWLYLCSLLAVKYLSECIFRHGGVAGGEGVTEWEAEELTVRGFSKYPLLKSTSRIKKTSPTHLQMWIIFFLHLQTCSFFSVSSFIWTQMFSFALAHMLTWKPITQHEWWDILQREETRAFIEKSTLKEDFADFNQRCSAAALHCGEVNKCLSSSNLVRLCLDNVFRFVFSRYFQIETPETL